MINRVQSTPITLGTKSNVAANYAMTASDGSGISLYASGDTNVKPPDYHLPFTGDQVVEALWKIINLNLKEVGGITKIDSSEENPFNLDTLTTGGNYMTDYITGSTVPEEFQGMKPININVAIKTNEDGSNTIIQIVESGGNKYYRWTKDGGITWSKFAPKSTNSGPIDDTGDPTADPPKDPVTVLEERTDKNEQDITNIFTTINNMKATALRLGTPEIGTQIMNGTFDYDTVIPAPAS